MVFGLGRTESVIFEEEATFGQTSTFSTYEHFGYDTVLTPNFSYNFGEIDNNGGTDSEMVGMNKNKSTFAFTLDFIPTNFKWAKFCTHPLVTNTGTAPVVHTFTKDLDIASFGLKWLRKQDTDQIFDFKGCTIIDWKLSWSKGTGAKDAYLKISANCVAQNVVESTSISVTPLSETPYKFTNIKYTLEDNEITEVNSGELNVNNNINVDDSSYANATLDELVGKFISTKKTYDFSINCNQKDKSLFATYSGLELTGVNKLEIIRGTDDNVVFSFNKLYIDNAIGATNLEGITNVDVVGRPMSLDFEVKDEHDDY